MTKSHSAHIENLKHQHQLKLTEFDDQGQQKLFGVTDKNVIDQLQKKMLEEKEALLNTQKEELSQRESSGKSVAQQMVARQNQAMQQLLEGQNTQRNQLFNQVQMESPQEDMYVDQDAPIRGRRRGQRAGHLVRESYAFKQTLMKIFFWRGPRRGRGRGRGRGGY